MKYIVCFVTVYLFGYNVISAEDGNDNTNLNNDNKNITSCKTPGQEPGYCVSLLSCPHMVKAIATYKYEPINYFLHSICGNYKVCCGIRTTYDPTRFVFGDETFEVSKTDFEIPKTLNNTAAKKRSFVINNILPSTRYCGLQHTDDRIYTDNETALDEIPWLVNFVATDLINRGPTKTDDFYHYCAGVLISSQHILSSSYCSYKRFNIKAVRLGQHHLRRNSTCVTDPIIIECANLIEIPVEEYLVIGDSNFVLYKLQRPVMYDDYIRPICLPLNDLSRPTINGLLTTSGWKDTKNENKIGKKRIISKILEHETCNEGFNNSIRYGKVNPKYALCTLKEPASNSEIEKNDQGSPFTYSYKHQWFIDGIVNYIAGDYLIGEKLTSDIRNWILDGLYYFYEQSQNIPKIDIRS